MTVFGGVADEMIVCVVRVGVGDVVTVHAARKMTRRKVVFFIIVLFRAWGLAEFHEPLSCFLLDEGCIGRDHCDPCAPNSERERFSI